MRLTGRTAVVTGTSAARTWLWSRAAVPEMQRQGSGSIITLVSQLAIVGLARTMYCRDCGPGEGRDHQSKLKRSLWSQLGWVSVD